MGVTLRVGINAAEVVDCVLGWLGIDIFNDDSAASNTVTGELSVPLAK